MKTWRLVSGILSCILFAIVSFQSCAAGLSNAIQDNGEVSGSAGIILAVFMLTAGIISIAGRKNISKGPSIAIIILDGIAALMGYSNAGGFADLKVWSTWCLLCAILAVVAIFKAGPKEV